MLHPTARLKWLCKWHYLKKKKHRRLSRKESNHDTYQAVGENCVSNNEKLLNKLFHSVVFFLESGISNTLESTFCFRMSGMDLRAQVHVEGFAYCNVTNCICIYCLHLNVTDTPHKPGKFLHVNTDFYDFLVSALTCPV